MDMDLRKLLIDNLKTMGQSEDAIRENLLIADIYMQLAELERASQICQEAMRLCQNANGPRRLEAEILRRIADIDTQRLDWKQALHNYEQVKNIQPDDEKTRKAIIDIYFHLGQADKAILEARDFMLEMVNAGQSTRATGFIQLLCREYPENTGLLSLAGEEVPQKNDKSQTIDALNTVGEELMNKGDINGAIDVIEQIIAMAPPNVTEYTTLLDQLKKSQIS
jgi:tetratricopeptide (TPR) repeat protein